MIHIGSISSGLSSAVMCDRLLQKHPDAHLVFEDVLFEDEDNYRFLDDCEKRWGVNILRLTEGRNPYEVSRDHNMIPSSFLAPCSFDLKVYPFNRWLSNMKGLDITVYIGYDYTEFERMERTTKAYAKEGYKTDYPLEWKPIEFRPYSQVVREDWGIEPPRMYRLGYTHANCGGRCCKQGQGDWLRTLINFPERYAEIEEWEKDMRTLSEKHSKRTILKRINNGIVEELTLEKLRLENEDNQQIDFFDLDTKSPCVVCGIGF